MLGANQGTELILSGKGNDANIAIQEIAEYFERNFDEIA
jgi:phosphotransferase system HPr-like phosphotransfer protein